MGYERETERGINWSDDWVNDDVKGRVFLFLDVDAVSGIDKARVVRSGSGVRLDLLPCSEDDRVYHRGEGFEYFFMYSCVLELRVRLLFSDFQCQVLKQLNCAPSQLHPNCWVFLCAFEILMEFLEEIPSVELFFSLFQAKGVWKGGWVNLNSSPRFGIFKLYKSSFKNFKEMYVKVRNCEADFPFYLYENLGEKFPLWWCSEPQNILRPEIITPRDECIIEFLTEVVDRKELISVYDLLQWEENKDAVIAYLGGKYTGVSAASLRAQVKSKGFDKEGSTSKAEKVGTGKVDQLKLKRKKVILKRKKSDVVDLSEDSDERVEIPVEELQSFHENQRKLHDVVEKSESSSLWGKDYPFMVTVDEVCQAPFDVVLAEEVGDVAIDQYMQVVGLRLASLGRSREKIHRKIIQKKDDLSLKNDLAIKTARISELEVKLAEVEKHLNEVKESYAKDVEDLKKKESDLSALSARVIEVTAQLKEVEKNKQGEILDSFLEGFERASLQARFLAPEVDFSAMDPCKVIQDGVMIEDDGAAEQEDENVQ